MNYTQLKDKWTGKRVRETAELGYQCVAWAKKAMLEMYGYKSGSFG